jgi:hypothetical protein
MLKNEESTPSDIKRKEKQKKLQAQSRKSIINEKEKTGDYNSSPGPSLHSVHHPIPHSARCSHSALCVGVGVAVVVGSAHPPSQPYFEHVSVGVGCGVVVGVSVGSMQPPNQPYFEQVSEAVVVVVGGGEGGAGVVVVTVLEVVVVVVVVVDVGSRQPPNHP